MGKITAYKVNNLSKVDLRFYKEGDHFITHRSVGMLTNGKMKTLQDKSDLMTELNDLKNRVKALEDVRGRNYWVNYLMFDLDNYETIDNYDYYTVSGLKPNTDYTMSINPDIDLDSIPKLTSGNKALRINNKKENPVLNVINVLPDRVETFERTVTSTKDGVLYIINYKLLQDELGELTPKGIIIKESNVVQDWTPTPADL